MKLNYPLDCHPCRMSYASVKNFIEKNGYDNDTLDTLLIEGSELINDFSQILKSPNTGISKTPFYILKGLFTYFLVCLAFTTDEQSDYKLEIIGHDENSNLYKIKFTVTDGRSFVMNVQDSIDKCKGVFKFLSTMFEDKPLNDTITEITSGLTVDNAKRLYSERLITWCNETGWFFTIFYNSHYLMDVLPRIMKGTCYMINRNPRRDHVKWMLHRFDVDAWMVDNDGNIFTRELPDMEIRKCFQKIDLSEWKSVHRFYKESYLEHVYDDRSVAPVVIKGFDKQDIPVLPPMVKEHNTSVCHLLNSLPLLNKTAYYTVGTYKPFIQKNKDVVKYAVVEEFDDYEMLTSEVIGIFDSQAAAATEIRKKEKIWEEYAEIQKQPDPEWKQHYDLLEADIPDFMYINPDVYMNAIVFQLYNDLIKLGYSVTYDEVYKYHNFMRDEAYIGRMSYSIKKVSYGKCN